MLDWHTALPYICRHADVIETPTVLADVRSQRLDEEDRAAIVSAVAKHPMAGDLMPGTGGARKRRIAGRGKGKSGGYRVITYYGGEDVPVFLLVLLSKGERADLSQADKNELRKILSSLADDYRKGVEETITRLMLKA
jgi:hypothetical protein